jgi:hypothetical protein
MPGRTIRPLLAAIAIAAAALGVAGTATAAPTGPCKEVPYVGVCEPLGEEPRSPSQQSMGEAVIPGADNNIQTVN